MARPLYASTLSRANCPIPLAPGIACIVPLALYGTKEHTFPEAGHPRAHPVWTGHSRRTPLPSPAIPLRKAGRYRHQLEYFPSLFLPIGRMLPPQPDQVLDKALAKASKDRTRYDFLQTLS